jgi:hypothetical protein
VFAFDNDGVHSSASDKNVIPRSSIIMGKTGYYSCSVTNFSRLPKAVQLGNTESAIVAGAPAAFSSSRTEEKGVPFAKSDAQCQ